MPPGFFDGAQGLFGSLGGGATAPGAQGGNNMHAGSGLFAMLNNQSNPDFNPFEVPDVNPFIMAAMDKDIRDHGNQGNQAAGLEFMMQGLMGQNPITPNVNFGGLGAIFGVGAGMPMREYSPRENTPYAFPVDPANPFHNPGFASAPGPMNQDYYSPNDVSPQVLPGHSRNKLILGLYDSGMPPLNPQFGPTGNMGMIDPNFSCVNMNQSMGPGLIPMGFNAPQPNNGYGNGFNNGYGNGNNYGPPPPYMQNPNYRQEPGYF